MKKELTLDEIISTFKGKGGGPEAESVLVDNNHDKKDNFVTIWSNKNDLVKIISRCKNSIKKFEMIGDGVQLTIDRKAFRGILSSFRKT